MPRNRPFPLSVSSHSDTRRRSSVALIAAVLLAACAGEQIRAASWIGPAGGTTVTGRAEFVRRKAGLELLAHVTGLMPGSDYRLLLAERADSSGRAGPQGVESPPVKADAYGNAKVCRRPAGLTLLDGERLAGKVVIVRQVHSDGSQPAGQPGAEAGCGWGDR